MTWDAAIVMSGHIFYKPSGQPLSLAAGGCSPLLCSVTICLFAPFSLTEGLAEHNPIHTFSFQLGEAFNCGSG